MRRRRIAVAAAAVLTAFVLPAGASARDWPQWLAPCGPGRLCGTFDVPLDRTSPQTAGTIGLNVVVVPAAEESQRAPEAIVPITGGPGGASTDLLAWAQTTFFVAAQRRDLLLVDQRGTGRSRPLYCPSPELLAATTDPDRIRAYWIACLGGVGVDPRLFTTAVAMDDLDDLRGALGYPRVDLYGVSYGATAAQYFLLRHGDRVRTAILDGGTLLDVPIFERYAKTNQAMLDRLFARCARQRSCAAAFPAPARDLRVVLDRLGRAPVRYRGTTIDRDDVANAVQHLSRKPNTAALIPLVLRRAAKNGVASVIGDVQQYAPVTDENVSVMSWAIRCLEPWASRDPARTAALGAGTYLGPTMNREARFAAAACAPMPPFEDVAGADRRVASAVPALVVVGGQDPQDPLENIAGITSAMPNAKIVVVRGAGHGAVNHGCTEDLANRFIARGTAVGLDTRCAAQAPLTPFALR